MERISKNHQKIQIHKETKTCKPIKPIRVIPYTTYVEIDLKNVNQRNNYVEKKDLKWRGHVTIIDLF